MHLSSFSFLSGIFLHLERKRPYPCLFNRVLGHLTTFGHLTNSKTSNIPTITNIKLEFNHMQQFKKIRILFENAFSAFHQYSLE